MALAYKNHPLYHHHLKQYFPVMKRRVYAWYPFLIIIYGLVKLFEVVILTSPTPNEKLAYLFVDLSMAWLVFNLVLFIRFLTGGFEPIAFVMPIYYTIDYLLSLVFGYLLASLYGFQSLAGQTWFIILTTIFVAFEIGFGLYLLFRRL